MTNEYSNKSRLTGHSLERLYISLHDDKVLVRFPHRKNKKNPIVLELLSLYFFVCFLFVPILNLINCGKFVHFLK